MTRIDYKLLGDKIKIKRKEKGYTQESLAEMCNISTGFLGHIENGSRTPSLETLFGIANALGCGLDFLLYDSSVNENGFLSAIGDSVRKKSDDSYNKLCKI